MYSTGNVSDMEAQQMASVAILVAVMVIALVALAAMRRIDWFGLLKWAPSRSGRDAAAGMWTINDGGDKHLIAGFNRPNMRITVINDGYGSESAPYEYWENDNNDEVLDWDTYTDVVGYQTRDEVAQMVRRNW